MAAQTIVILRLSFDRILAREEAVAPLKTTPSRSRLRSCCSKFFTGSIRGERTPIPCKAFLLKIKKYVQNQFVIAI